VSIIKSMIGIRTADGNLLPILNEDEKIRKKLILTTVTDDQPVIHIDLYRWMGESMDQAEQIGRLKIENIPPGRQGEPDIALLVGMDPEGNLISRAYLDKPDTEEQSLIVRLSEPSSSPTGEFAPEEFQMRSMASETEEAPSNGTREQLYFNTYAPEPEEKGRRKNLALILGTLGILLILIGVGYFFLRNLSQQPTAQVVQDSGTQEIPAVPSVSPSAVPTPSPRAEAVKEPETPPPQKPESIGVWYSTVKGDNLWNLARSFYRNPWLYKKIAEENGITNPDFILQDARLYIPDVETGKQ
jgi:hypothetical protein